MRTFFSVGILVILFGWAMPISAATLNVACSPGDLVNKINTANGTTTGDTLELAQNCAYELNAQLPTITEDLIIEGNSAQIFRSFNQGTGNFRLMQLASGVDLTLLNLTMQNGNTLNAGGALYSEGNLTVENVAFVFNFADDGGGAIYQNGGSATNIVNSRFLSNSSDNHGGALYLTGSGGAWTIETTRFENNTTQVDSPDCNTGCYGGAVYNDGKVVTIFGSELTSNTARIGGAVYNSIIANIDTSILRGNEATNGRGGAIANTISLNVQNSVLTGNLASGEGGAISSVVVNPSVTGTSIRNSTIASNRAGGDGGGVALATDVPEEKEILNSIIVRNIAFGSNNQIDGNISTVSYTAVDGGYPGTGNIDLSGNTSDEIFVNASSGQPNDEGDFRLVNGSPAIGQGNPALLPEDVNDLDKDANTNEPIPFDVRNDALFPRVFGANPDMGAYENQCSSFSSPESVADGSVSEFVFAINCANVYGEPAVIELAANGNYTFDSIYTYDNAEAALPYVTAEITINGNNATLTRDPQGDDLRFFNVDGSSNYRTGRLVLNDMTLTGGDVNSSGGAVEVNDGNLQGTNATFTNNQATDNGGAIVSNGNYMEFTDSTFTSNTAVADDGGAISATETTLILTDTNLEANTAGSRGGAVYQVTNRFEVRGGIFTSNTASSSTLGGGAIYTTSDEGSIVSASITSNQAYRGGGVYVLGSDGFYIVSTHIKGNSASDSGGGIFNNQSSLNIYNALISGNLATFDGGGIVTNNSNNLTVINTTLASNKANLGSMVCAQNGATNISFVNSIIWGHVGQEYCTTVPVINYSGIEGGYPGTGNVTLGSVNNIFVSPQSGDNAPTPDGNYALLYNAPVVNQGDNGSIPMDMFDLDGDTNTTEPLPYDIRGMGFPRVNHTTVDMGAYEYKSNGDIDDNGSYTPADAIFVINRVGQTTPPADIRADIDGNGIVEQSDAQYVIDLVGTQLP